jgi:hypothetical protein
MEREQELAVAHFRQKVVLKCSARDRCYI